MDDGQRISLQYVALEVDASSTAGMWQVYTAIGNPRNDGTDRQKQEHYFRFLADHLVNTLQRQIDQGRIAPDTGDRLTVFAAPEFYFTDRNRATAQPTAAGLPFDWDVVRDGLEYLEGRLADFEDDILVCAGSVWAWEAYTETTDDHTGMAGEDAPNAAIHNLVPSFYRGRRVHSWHKKRLSPIDGLGDPNANWGPATHWDQVVTRDGRTEHQLEAGDADPYFTVRVGDADVVVGIEVCLDHGARTRYLRNHNQGDLDLHVLVCAGMDADGASIACRTGGVFLRCEGGRGFGGERSNCGTLTAQNARDRAVPADVDSATHETVAGRAAHVDERVRVFEAVEIRGGVEIALPA